MLAVLCSGQGPQHSQMFALTSNAPAAAELFDHAATLLGGRDPRELVIAETDEALHTNRIGQILCTLQPLAVFAALGGFGGARFMVAGYSVGELPAWSLAGFLAPKTALDLAAQRAKAMDAVATLGDGLLFVRGLDSAKIDALCRQFDVEVAIFNPGGAVVLGGAGDALDAAARAAERGGALRVQRLGVTVASHTSRLAPASTLFRKDLDAALFSNVRPTQRLLSGTDGTSVLDGRNGLDKLAAQISSTVHWSDCMAACVEAGATAFLECGPGRALADMAAAAFPPIPARTVDDFRTLQGLSDWLPRMGV